MSEDKKHIIMAWFVPELVDIQELLEKKKIGYAAVSDSKLGRIYHNT